MSFANWSKGSLCWLAPGEYPSVEQKVRQVSLFYERTEHNLYQKRDSQAKDANMINDYICDTWNSNMDAEDKPVSADDVELRDVNKIHHPGIQNMLKKHQNMWSGSLGAVNITEKQTDLVEKARRFRSHGYRARLNASKLE